MSSRPAGPWQLVEKLRDYAVVTSWCEWLELGGSLGRGAGDEWSDVDAALGVHPQTPLSFASAAALAAARTFAPVAAELTTPFGLGPAAQHDVQYADGRQLSLVVMPAAARNGLPPGAVPLVDRSGRLARLDPPTVLTADDATRREWGFRAWWGIGDAVRHLRRGAWWRTVTALDAARAQAWRLYADTTEIEYPVFGAVSVENAGRTAPDWMAATVPQAIDRRSLEAALNALVGGLEELTGASPDPVVLGVRDVVAARLAEFRNQPSSIDNPA